MDQYIVSARKYRPSTFQSVVGQKALTVTLKNAIVANKLAHAYLFSGPRGVGKTTCARIFAKTINCLNPTKEHEACNQCESCVAFNEQRSYNIHELDAASNNGVEDIRTLIEQVRIPPQIGTYKVYIIDEVHMLSQAAFNSFLKTLEEPPAHALFILATTEKHKIIPTILSRCQVYDFDRISISDIVEHLEYVAKQEGVTAETEALHIIAQKADGGMRDALSMFDQAVSYSGGNITYRSVIENLNVLDYEYYFKLTEAIVNGNVSRCLLILNDILRSGFEGQSFITGLSTHFRDLLVSKDAETVQLIQVSNSVRERYASLAQQCSNNFLYEAIDIANECDLNYRVSKNKRLLVELALIKMCQLNRSEQPMGAEKKRELKPIEKGPKYPPATSTPAEPKKKQPTRELSETKSAAYPSAAESQERIKHKSEAERSEEKPTENSIEGRRNRVHTPMADMGISISSLSKMKADTSTAATEPKKKISASQPFTQEELVTAWKQYADSLTKEKLLKNAMSLYLPQLREEHRFEVEVNSELNKQFLTDNSLSILTFLREKLNNGAISMSIQIAESNAVKKALTPHEIFEEMVKENPSLQKLSDEFGLELS